jgi:hypothetical protein
MALSDPPEGFDALAAMYDRNIALLGHDPYREPGQQADMLEREAEHQAHQEAPGGGTSWRRVQGDGPDPTADPLNVNARRAALGLRPLAGQEPVRTTVTIDGFTVERGEEIIETEEEAQ